MMQGENSFLVSFGKAFVPERFRDTLREYLSKAGYSFIPYHTFGILFFVDVFLTILGYFFGLYPFLVETNVVVITLVTFFYFVIMMLFVALALMVGIYFFLNIRIYKRTQIIEDHLPEYLTLVSTNLKGGLSFEDSLWASIKPEFGLLSKEMMIVSKNVMTGSELTSVLRAFGKKYPSPILERTLNLLISELSSGGRIAEILDKSIENLRKTRILKAEMSAATLSYMIFIGAIVMFVAPLLFALAYQLLFVIQGFSQDIGSGLSASGVISLSFDFIEGSGMDTGDFRLFSIAALSIISIASSMIISIIERGDVRAGLKYIPFFFAVANVMYYVFFRILASVFSGMIG
ncbi:MAG: type II secretion system F family protein [Candidatus Woesearchaeota archaeon]|nr:MAG: type II secretion system F family protein [Candidatus Woesearchaeota archaeon]